MRIDSRSGQSNLHLLALFENAFNEPPPFDGPDRMRRLPILALNRIQRPKQLGLRRQQRGGRGTSAAPAAVGTLAPDISV